jgi:hypothetical protein
LAIENEQYDSRENIQENKDQQEWNEQQKLQELQDKENKKKLTEEIQKEKYQQPPVADKGIRESYKICHNGSLSMQHDYDSIMPAWVL